LQGRDGNMIELPCTWILDAFVHCRGRVDGQFPTSPSKSGQKTYPLNTSSDLSSSSASSALAAHEVSSITLWCGMFQLTQQRYVPKTLGFFQRPFGRVLISILNLECVCRGQRPSKSRVRAR
jgi:hypothetical protein